MTAGRWARVRASCSATAMGSRRPRGRGVRGARGCRRCRGSRRGAVAPLASHSRAGQFLNEPVAETIPSSWIPDEPLPAGTVVGSYALVRELGRGGMGRAAIAALATDARLGRTVALKVLARLTSCDDPRQRDRLRREARAAAALSHPGICTVYALGSIDNELQPSPPSSSTATPLAMKFEAARVRRRTRSSGPPGTWSRRSLLPPGGDRPSRLEARQRHARTRRAVEDSSTSGWPARSRLPTPD